MIQVIIPAAGLGSRFFGSKFVEPKPLIKWDNRTMIEHVVDNLNGNNVIFYIVSREEHNLQEIFNGNKNVNVVNINGTTSGPASTCYILKDVLDPENKLIIANCDQIVKDLDINIFSNVPYDGNIGCFTSIKNHNSYVKVKDNLVTIVREKEVISNIATNGVHFWKKADYFFSSYVNMLDNDDNVNGEFYVAPTYNYLINNGLKITHTLFNEHHPIGTPDDLTKYLNGDKQN